MRERLNNVELSDKKLSDSSEVPHAHADGLARNFFDDVLPKFAPRARGRLEAKTTKKQGKSICPTRTRTACYDETRIKIGVNLPHAHADGLMWNLWHFLAKRQGTHRTRITRRKPEPKQRKNTDKTKKEQRNAARFGRRELDGN